jgi:peptidoglycan/xylan/chitin deacetylase (PgdA/CDA1 family)
VSRVGDAARVALGGAAHRARRDRPGDGSLAVLTFHRVGDRRVLADDLAQLRRVSTPVPLDAVRAAHRGDEALPAGAVLVTFDDGHHSVADAAPVLAGAGVPAVCFVVSHLVGTDTPFWWDEVVELGARGARWAGDGPDDGMDLVNHLKTRPDGERRAVLDDLRGQVAEPVVARQLTPAELHDMEAAGIAVGGHSATHPILPRCPDDVLAAEVGDCRTRLAELLGRAPTAFAYPSGGEDDRVVAAVAAAGWELGFAWDHRVATVPFADPLRIARARSNVGSGRARLALLALRRHPSLR